MSQFKALFPASATPSKLLTEKFPVELKFLNVWGNHTLDDLKNLVSLFGVPGKHLHLSNVKDGCIAVIWLCSTLFIKELKPAIFEVASLLQTKGLLKVFIEEELVLECYQPDQQGTTTVYIAFVPVHICAVELCHAISHFDTYAQHSKIMPYDKIWVIDPFNVTGLTIS